MKTVRKILHLAEHLFLPHESNNQNARLLHSSSLTFIVSFLVLYQIILNFIPAIRPSILGFAANISPSEVIRLTNEKRAAAGLSALEENSVLSQAAQAKGNDMLAKGYWAHMAPDGTSPWKFFTDFGYKYRYAGENLARDFSNPSSAIEAWMASPTHRDNVLSSKYKEVGVAVVEGSLAGVDTTIVVQFFGTKLSGSPGVLPVAQAKPQPSATPRPQATILVQATPKSSQTPALTISASPKAEEAGVSGKPRFVVLPFTSTKNLSLIIIITVLAVLILDGVIINRRKIVRIGGRTFAHITFLGAVLVIVLILKAGSIL